MKSRDEDDYLMISGIQHYVFCKRQWSFIHVEKQWEENLRTVEGDIFHHRAHDINKKEKRGNVITTRAMKVYSKELGISGECDVVEFHKSKDGVEIFGWDGKYLAIPIEYKKGVSKTNDADRLQLCAQAICLEEMLCCDVSYGYLYYGESKRREKVELTEELRAEVIHIVGQMHEAYERGYTFKPKRTKACNACSLKNVCLPMIEKKASVLKYIDKVLEE